MSRHIKLQRNVQILLKSVHIFHQKVLALDFFPVNSMVENESFVVILHDIRLTLVFNFLVS